MDALGSYFQLGPAIQVLGYGLAVAAILVLAVALWAALRSWRSASQRFERLDHGIAEFEARQQSRIGELEGQLAEMRLQVEETRRQMRLNGIVPLLGTNPSREDTEALPALPRRTQESTPAFSGSPDDAPRASNIVHLREAFRRDEDEEQAARANPGKLAKRVKEAIGAGKVEAWYQPVIALPSRAARYFEAHAVLDLGDEAPAPAEDWLGCATRRGLAGEVSRQMLVECFCLARRLRRDKHEGVVIWSISRAAVAEAHDRERLDALLSANASLGRKLLVGVTVNEYRAGDQTFLDFLNHVRETGFELALLDGNDIAEAEKIVATGLFRLAALNARTILAQGSGRHNSAATSIMAADPRQKIEIAATDIESEETALELIDCDVLLAQGQPFSGPKPLSKGGSNPEDGTATRA